MSGFEIFILVSCCIVFVFDILEYFLLKYNKGIQFKNYFDYLLNKKERLKNLKVK